MPFGMGSRVSLVNYLLDGVQIGPREWAFLKEDYVGILQHAAEHHSSVPDVGIFPHAVDQRFDWPTADAVDVHIKFSRRKIPPAMRPVIKIL